MVPVTGWNNKLDGVQAEWNTDPSKIVIGQTYIFQAILKSIKSSDLKGSPIFKPEIGIDYNRNINEPVVNSNSVIIIFPDNTISASFSADNVIEWHPYYQDNWYHFSFKSKVSQITPPPPPFHVIAPANVQIEPDTLNPVSNGEWITAYIEFPEVYDVNNIVASTIRLINPSGEVPIDLTAPAIVGDYDSDGISDLMVKFDRGTVISLLGSTYVVYAGTGTDQQFELKVVGQLIDETQFEGTDTVKVIRKGK